MLKLHHTSNTRSGRIIWLLEELGLPYDLNTIPFSNAALKSEEHRARHPLGRIPVLEDGDVNIFESGAIVEYILARHGDGGLKPAVDSAEFPYYLQWFHYCEGMVMPSVNTIVVHTLILPEDRRDPVVLGQAQRLLKKALGPVNQNLAGKEYLIGDFSAADVMLGHSCIMSGRLGVIDEAMPHLSAYVDRLNARPAVITAFSK
jgi:glutathione S-transferase